MDWREKLFPSWIQVNSEEKIEEKRKILSTSSLWISSGLHCKLIEALLWKTISIFFLEISNRWNPAIIGCEKIWTWKILWYYNEFKKVLSFLAVINYDISKFLCTILKFFNRPMETGHVRVGQYKGQGIAVVTSGGDSQGKFLFASQ